MNLFISGKPRIKRSGDFPGRWSKLRGEGRRENIDPIWALIKGAEGDGGGSGTAHIRHVRGCSA